MDDNSAIKALLEINHWCPTCKSKKDPKIDDCFIICSGCGRIKRKLVSDK